MITRPCLGAVIKHVSPGELISGKHPNNQFLHSYVKMSNWWRQRLALQTWGMKQAGRQDQKMGHKDFQAVCK